MSRSKSKSKHKPTKPQKPIKERSMALALVTPERMRHDPVEMVPAIGTDADHRAEAGRKMGKVQEPLERYRDRGHIGEAACEIGQAYGRLRYEAGLVPSARAQQLHVRVDGSAGGLLPGEANALALERLLRTDAAIARESGRRRAAERHVGVLAAVCAEGRSAHAWAYDAGHRKHGVGLVYLRRALAILARVWGRDGEALRKVA